MQRYVFSLERQWRAVVKLLKFIIVVTFSSHHPFLYSFPLPFKFIIAAVTPITITARATKPLP